MIIYYKQIMSITLENVNNTSIDNSSKTITGLFAQTDYKMRAILTHGATGKMAIIENVKDEADNVISFTTGGLEIVTFTVGTISTVRFYRIDTSMVFSSTLSSAYDLHIFLWAQAAGKKLPGSTIISNVIDGETVPLSFLNLAANTLYQTTIKFWNRRSKQWYNAGNEYTLFSNIRTKGYSITSTIDNTGTRFNARQSTVRISSLSDNGDNLGLGIAFDTVRFVATASPTDIKEITRTNLAMFDISNPSLELTFRDMTPSSIYTLTGYFTRTGLYTDIVRDFGFMLVTAPITIAPIISTIIPGPTSIIFTMSNILDNTGDRTHVTIRIIASTPGQVDKEYEFLGVPYNSSRSYTLTGLSQGVTYAIKARFTKVNQYTDFEVFLFNETTINLVLQAGITVNSIVPFPNQVNFNIVDFQSEFSDGHTIQILALRLDQSIIIQEGLIAYWTFGVASLTDGVGNQLVVTGEEQRFDDPYILTQEPDIFVTWTPPDWAIFDQLNKDFRMVFDLEIPTLAVSNRFSAKFNMAGYLNAFEVNIIGDMLHFKVSSRGLLDDIELLICDLQYNLSTFSGGFFGARHTIEFLFKILPNITLQTQTFAIAKILIDDVERASNSITNMAGYFSQSTVLNGPFINILTPALTNNFQIILPITGTKLHAFKMGSQSRTIY